MSHAILSPSGASRWLTCTLSPLLEKGIYDQAGSAAEEGTLAHELGETILREKLGIPHKKGKKYHDIIETIIANPMYDHAMQQHVEDYVSVVLGARSKGSHTFIEKRVNITNYVPDGFGTADAIVITDGLLDFFDLKYGKGVPVSAVDNSQLKLYALGALNDYSDMFEIHTVRLNIFQPRLFSHSVWEISVVDLIEWAEDIVKPRAEMATLAYKGKQNTGATAKAGEHCRFCKAKFKCKALANYNLELAKHDFAEPSTLTDDEIAEILQKLDLLNMWSNAVQEYAFAQALAGKKWPGFKLVEGRSVRAYSDEKAVEEKLSTKGYNEIYSTPKLLGITALEKAIGKQPFSEIVVPLLVKPKGKPTLVPASDKRQEYNSAKNDFAE